MKNHYVYQIRNILNNKIYVGKRTCECDIKDDSYMGSGYLIKKAIEKYGLASFEKTILKEFKTEQCAYSYESKIVTEAFVKRSDTYNIALGGGTPQVPMVRVWKKGGKENAIRQLMSVYKSKYLDYQGENYENLPFVMSDFIDKAKILIKDNGVINLFKRYQKSVKHTVSSRYEIVDETYLNLLST